tara:strand:+ start:3181 stop:3297 length:117 start_codon:yes stop_codon:yes gene_type:complete
MVVEKGASAPFFVGEPPSTDSVYQLIAGDTGAFEVKPL